MATLKEIETAIQNKTFDPTKLNQRQRNLIDNAIDQGFIKGPKTDVIIQERKGATRDIQTLKAAQENPIGVRLQQEQSKLDGRSEAILAGDLIGSITPYVTQRKKIFSEAKSKIPGNKYTGLFARTNKFKNMADNLTNRLPGRFKLFGGALKVLAKAADPTIGRIVNSPLGKTEIMSVLGGSVGAGAGSITFDMLNETAGVYAMDAIQQDLKDQTPREVNTNMLSNAMDATFTALAWNAGAATLTPFLLKGLGKLGRLSIGAKSPDSKELVAIARDKGLPLPLVMTARENVGLLGGISKSFFKVIGIFPFIGGIGREALQGAEQKAGREYLNNSVLNYGPLMKTSLLSATIFKQADEAFKANSALINSSYRGFETLANTIRNPKVIPTTKLKRVTAEYIEGLQAQFPQLRAYAEDALGALPVKDIAKLTNIGDPLANFMRYANSVDEFVTPTEYKGLITTLNRAIEGTTYQNIRPTLWAIREALENDLNSFGEAITKETFFKDQAFKEGYENLVKTSGKAAADADLKFVLDQSKELKNQLYRANDVFATLMNFYQRAGISGVFRKYDATKFTNKALAGIGGIERKKAQRFFNDLANDVFTHGDSTAIKQFRQIIGADRIVSKKTGAQIGITKGGGQALYNASKARWMWNSFIKSFESSRSPAGQKMLDEIMNDAGVRAGINGTVDVMESMVKKQVGTDEVLDFSIDKVRRGDGIFDATKIRFSPRDTAGFKINTFLKNLGIDDITDDVAREKLITILGGRKNAQEFERFVTYMKAVSDTPIADTSTFMQRRFQLGGLNSLTGTLVLGGSAAVNPFAPALFILLARRAGQILTDPVAMRAWNDALNPEEQISVLMGKKLGDGVPGVLGIGRRYFKGRDIQTIANIRQTPSVVGRLGLTQKREAFARIMNYLHENDSDVPRVRAQDVTPEEITDRLLQLDSKVPDPIYDENTIPKENFETMFAQDYSGTSGNIDIDNDAVTFLRQATINEADTEEQEKLIEGDERGLITEDLELENPVQQPQPQAPTPPNTGQVTQQQVAGLFPDDNLSQLIAQRRTRG